MFFFYTSLNPTTNDLTLGYPFGELVMEPHSAVTNSGIHPCQCGKAIVLTIANGRGKILAQSHFPMSEVADLVCQLSEMTFGPLDEALARRDAETAETVPPGVVIQ